MEGAGCRKKTWGKRDEADEAFLSQNEAVGEVCPVEACLPPLFAAQAQIIRWISARLVHASKPKYFTLFVRRSDLTMTLHALIDILKSYRYWLW